MQILQVLKNQINALILTEEIQQNSAIAGLSVYNARDIFGVFPLKGNY